MKSPKHWIIAAMAAVLTLSIIAGASAQGGPPRLPASFEGTVTAPEGPVAAGLPVVAEIGGKRCNDRDAATFLHDGDIWYVVIVDHSSTGPDFAGCGALGAEVRFKVGDRYATQLGTWSIVPPRQTLNLTLEPLPPPPPPPPETVDIDVRVWQHMRNLSNIHVSARPEGARWGDFGTKPLAVDDGPLPGSSFHFGDITLTVSLPNGETTTIDIRVWQHMRNLTNIHVSARPEGARWADFGTKPLAVDDGPLPGSSFHYGDITLTVTLQGDSE